MQLERGVLEFIEILQKNLSMRLKTVHQKHSVYTNFRTGCLLTGFYRNTVCILEHRVNLEPYIPKEIPGLICQE